MPVTAICYGALAPINAQTHLLLGRYLESFDVTDKATFASREKAKKSKNRRRMKKQRK